VVRVDGGGDERLVDELVQFLAQSQARRVGALWVGERDDVEHQDGAVDRLGGHGITHVTQLSGPPHQTPLRSRGAITNLTPRRLPRPSVTYSVQYSRPRRRTGY
jgi:hypothetical protein